MLIISLRTIDQLKQSIQHEWNQISEETCQKVCGSVAKRCLDCIEVQGRHFKQLQIVNKFKIFVGFDMLKKGLLLTNSNKVSLDIYLP